MVLIQHLVSSLSVGGRSVHRVTIPDAVLIQFDLLMISIILLETCSGL
jgi:hypothetical protein